MKPVDEMTIKEAKDFLAQSKEIAALFGNPKTPEVNSETNGIYGSMIGKYVIVRSRNEGINSGFVEMADETGIALKSARRLWHHKPAVKTESWYEGVANHGLSNDSRISAIVERKIIVEDYSVTFCSASAQQSIEAAVAHAQS